MNLLINYNNQKQFNFNYEIFYNNSILFQEKYPNYINKIDIFNNFEFQFFRK